MNHNEFIHPSDSLISLHLFNGSHLIPKGTYGWLNRGCFFTKNGAPVGEREVSYSEIKKGYILLGCELVSDSEFAIGCSYRCYRTLSIPGSQVPESLFCTKDDIILPNLAMRCLIFLFSISNIFISSVRFSAFDCIGRTSLSRSLYLGKDYGIAAEKEN